MKVNIGSIIAIILLFPLQSQAQNEARQFSTDYSDYSDPSYSEPHKDWQVGASITYETGDFGTDTTTNTTYIPLTLKRLFDKGDVAFTLPFIHQESGPGVTAIGGRPFRTGSSSGSDRSDSGLGDMLVKGSYYLLSENEQPFNLAPFVRIKFPTAEEDEGLGTGEFDESIGFESSKTLSDKWAGYLDMEYTFIGDPDGAELDNQFTIAIGPGYRVSPDTIVSLLYQESTALVDGRSNPRDLLLDVTHKLDNTTKVAAGISVGLSNGSPDFGITAGANYKF